MQNPAALVSLLLTVPSYSLYQLASIRKKTMPNSLDSRRALRLAHLEQVGIHNRALKYPLYSVYQAAIQNRGQAYPLGLGIFKGWLGTWDVPELIKLSCVAQGTHPVQQVLNRQKLIHGRRSNSLCCIESSSIFKCRATSFSKQLAFFPLSLINQLVRLIELHSLRYKLSANFIKSNTSNPSFPFSSVQVGMSLR